jgi:hypothetical protein
MKILLLLLLFLVPATSPRVKSDREINQLQGTVRTFKTARAVFVDGKEGQRKPWQEMTFDSNGNYIEYTIYSNDNPSTYNYTNKYNSDGTASETVRSGSGEKTVFIYAPDSRRIEKLTQTNDGHALDKWVYTFDERGNKIKEEHILIDKTLGARLIKPIDVIVSRYDSQSRLTEEEYFDQDGSKATNPIVPIHRRTYVYNSRGRPTEIINYKIDGTIFTRTGFQYDERGNLTENTIYNGADVVTAKNTYSDYDAHGNWGHEIISTVSQTGAKTLAPSQSVYQTFTYY